MKFTTNFNAGEVIKEYFEFKSRMDAHEDLMKETARLAYHAIDRALIGRIEQIEGRVPADEEIEANGCKLIYPDGRYEYQWKGKSILRVDWWPVSEDNRQQQIVRITPMYEETP